MKDNEKDIQESTAAASTGDNCYVPDWFPQDPYPLSRCSIKNDDDYVKAVPDPKLRTALSWYLLGESCRMTSKRILEALKEHLDLGT